jgi:hypothetical protein
MNTYEIRIPRNTFNFLGISATSKIINSCASIYLEDKYLQQQGLKHNKFTNYMYIVNWHHATVSNDGMQQNLALAKFKQGWKQ